MLVFLARSQYSFFRIWWIRIYKRIGTHFLTSMGMKRAREGTRKLIIFFFRLYFWKTTPDKFVYSSLFYSFARFSRVSSLNPINIDEWVISWNVRRKKCFLCLLNHCCFSSSSFYHVDHLRKYLPYCVIWFLRFPWSEIFTVFLVSFLWHNESIKRWEGENDVREWQWLAVIWLSSLVDQIKDIQSRQKKRIRRLNQHFASFLANLHMIWSVIGFTFQGTW